jgi:hypothetical protein
MVLVDDLLHWDFSVVGGLGAECATPTPASALSLGVGKK